MLQKTDLFTARSEGYHTCRIPGLVCTPRGAILATCEARRGHGGDWDGSDILMRRSPDGGITWEPHRVAVRQHGYGEGPVSNFVMIADAPSGAVHALFCHNYARVYAMRSDDDGRSFSPPADITAALQAFRDEYAWRVIATGPGHGLQTRRGRLIVPIWMSDGSGAEFGPGRLGHRPSCVSLIYSDDHGRTWRRGEIVARHPDATNPSETAAVELSDGRVLFNIRTESSRHRRLIATSPDGVSGWSQPWYDEALLEPVCMASLVRRAWPAGSAPGQILFANPDNLEREFANWEPACDRKRLAVKLSDDDGRTWPVSWVLEDGPAGYSDLAVAADGAILCLYERGSLQHMGDIRAVTLARFDVHPEALQRGQMVSPG